jgi:hypothetical protein
MLSVIDRGTHHLLTSVPTGAEEGAQRSIPDQIDQISAGFAAVHVNRLDKRCAGPCAADTAAQSGRAPPAAVSCVIATDRAAADVGTNRETSS